MVGELCKYRRAHALMHITLFIEVSRRARLQLLG